MAIAAVTAAICVAFLFAPATSADVIGYAPRNDHLLGDVGSFQLAIPVALAGWAWRPDQRLGLWVALVAQATHAFSHLRDDLIGPAFPGSDGFTSFAPNLLSLALVLTVVLLATPRTKPTDA